MIINLLGGISNLISLIMMLLLLLVTNSLIKNKIIRAVASLLGSLFIVAEVFSLYSTQSFTGYQFFIHFNISDTIELKDVFGSQYILGIITFIVLFLINYTLFTIRKKYFKRINYSVLFMLFFTPILVIYYGDFIEDTNLLSLTESRNEDDFNATLERYKMHDYITSDDIVCTAGENIIIISMESLEKAFLNDKFSSLTPNLNALKDKWNYFDLTQNPGSDWTTASLYTYLTGFPAYFGIEGYNIFEAANKPGISSVLNVLDQANYKTIYINGDTRYAGVKNLLNLFKIDKISDISNADSTVTFSDFGLRDKEVFEIAKDEIDTLSKTNQHFAVFISTTDTHFPNGIYDERMESVISPKNSDLEFMVAALDYMIGEFISYLDKKNLLQNTTVYLFPDHLKMGDPTIFDASEERGLYLISNSRFIAEKQNLDLYQIDLPKVILEGANIKHNLTFLTDYIPEDINKETYIHNHIKEITDLNISGLTNSGNIKLHDDSVSENYEMYKKDTMRFIAHAGGAIDGHTYTNSLEALDENYRKGFRLFELDLLKSKDGQYIALHDWNHWASLTGYSGEMPLTVDEFLSHKILGKYTPLDMERINNWFSEHDDAILVTDKVAIPQQFTHLFIDQERLIMELFDDLYLKQALKIGGSSVMPSQSVIANLKISDVKDYAKKGIKYIAVSRVFIADHKELLKEFKKYGIKVYAYNVNATNGIDEDYVVKYEMDYIYGIYADTWSFE